MAPGTAGLRRFLTVLLVLPGLALACGRPECGSASAMAGASAVAGAAAGAIATGGDARVAVQGGGAQASQHTTVTVGNGRRVGDRVPDVTAPALTTSGDDMCTGSVSGGLGLSGLGAMLGFTFTDDHCQTIKATKLLMAIDRPEAAIRRACMDEKMRDALGDECQPVKETPPSSSSSFTH